MSRSALIIALLGLACASNAVGQESSSTQPAVTRREFEELKKENQELRSEIDQIKKAQVEQANNAQQDADDIDKTMQLMRQDLDRAKPGLEGFVLAGDANVGFVSQRGAHSSFFADLSPLILWQPPESRLLVETAFDLGIGGADVGSENTTVTLNLADISYDVCDYLTVGGGLFTVPFGQFHNHFDPPWINKFPDNPLAFDALAPTSEVGFFVKGAIPSGTTYWTYDFYLANGPNLITNDPNAAGQLNFNDFTDLNNNKAVGGRIGFLPFPDLETGYSFQFSDPQPAGFQHVHALLQAVDFHYKPTIREAMGQFDLSAEWIWSSLGAQTYTPTGSAPLTFGNYRQGGYVSLGYRPTLLDNRILRNFEPLIRFDSLRSPLNSPGGEHESRWTAGLDYWLTPYAVIKAAYEFDMRKTTPGQDAFILQFGYGL